MGDLDLVVWCLDLEALDLEDLDLALDPDLEVDMVAITTEWEESTVVVMTITGITMVATITEEAMATMTMEWEEITVIATVWKITIMEWEEIMEILEAMVMTIMEWTIMVWITMEEGMEI